MSQEFLMPELAESVVEGEIVKWLVAEGDTVALDQPVVEVMTDKVTVELPSPFAGKIEKFLAKEGDVVAVHAPIARFAGGSAAPAATPAATPAPAPATPAPAAPAPVAAGTVSDTESAVSGSYGMAQSKAKLDFGSAKKTAAPAAAVAGTNAFGRPLAVPAARALAREAGVDIATVPGSGPNGRVGMDDMRSFLAQASAPAATDVPATPAPAAVTPVPAAASAKAGVGLGVPPVQYKTPKGYEALEERVPLRGMRRIIAGQMQASHLYTVRTLTVDEVDMSALVALRERLKPVAEKAGAKLTYLPFIFKAVASALRQFPNLNSSLDEATQEIVRKRYYNLGCAVDTEAGLVVPVIKDAGQKSILAIGTEIGVLAAKAREGKLAPEDISGSTFSITNMGSAGSLLSFPIINVPDAAILGVQAIQERAVVRDGQIVARPMMYLSLSFDHRLVDGAEAARFCKQIVRLLENPDILLLEAI
jgi:2-oxoisovalerate dehydrogenase E2 component (dihydrolipoyl transacylase)